MNNNNDFFKTPSFYNNDEVFQKYLGQTSYYLQLQQILNNIISFSNSKNIIDFGFGNGDTIIKLALKYKHSNFIAIDNRKEMIELVQLKIIHNDITNIDLVLDDMMEYVNNININIDLVTMIYSFHHILDPKEEKIKFLKILYDKLRKGALVYIAETFIPEHANSDMDKEVLSQLWNNRSLEGYCSTFWNSLTSLNKNNIELSKQIATYCKTTESEAGNNVISRNNEYLVKVSWLKEVASNIGFTIKISEPVNSIGEHVILLEK
jgi:tRNA G46 methylase TrmB